MEGSSSGSNKLTVTDLEFEADLQRYPYNFKYWWNYLLFKRKAPPKDRNLLHERALRCLPGSYKLWFQYLQERMIQVQNRSIEDPAWDAVNRTFERALTYMNKMPRIWVEYCQFLLRQYKVTKSRQTLDAALRSLPITQHDRIWKIYLKFINQDFVPTETAIRCWKRYLQLEPYQVEDFLDYLIAKKRGIEVINCLVRVLNDVDFVSTKGRTKHQLWVQLCTLLSKQEEDVLLDNNLRTETIIRSGIKKFPAEVGQLWCALADFNIRLGRFEVARDIYEEGIMSVTTVKDFTQIYDAYAQFEESFLTAKIHELTEEEKVNPEAALELVDVNEDREFKALMQVCDAKFTKEEDIDFRASRVERMFERRPALLNAVLLRQNPHNVHEWQNRVKIFANSKEKVIATYTEAVSMIDPSRAMGKLSLLWIDFGKFYETLHDNYIQAIKAQKQQQQQQSGSESDSEGDEKDEKKAVIQATAEKMLSMARSVFEKAVLVNFKSVDELATVWTEYAEFEIRQKNYQGAYALLKRATVLNFTGPPNWKHDPSEPVQSRLWKSVRLWSFYVDLDESLGTLRSTSAIYEKMVDLKVATPNIILNYASFLQERKCWEESFKAYEKGIALFHWPQVFDLWVAYLTNFVKRYKGTKLERLRDLFQQALDDVPVEFAERLHLMYASAEETYGLTKAAMAVYDKAIKAVKEERKVEVYKVWINKAAEYFGVVSTRTIYEQAIQTLPDKYVPEMCLKFAETELSLGEVDRARALYVYCSQFVNPASPAVCPEFWKKWHSFEVSYGNEETFREMLRVRRSVQASFASSGMTFSGGVLKPNEQQQQQQDLSGNNSSLKRERDSSEVSPPPTTPTTEPVAAASVEIPDEVEVKMKPMNLEDLVKLKSQEGEDPNSRLDEVDIDNVDIDLRGVEEKQLPAELFGGLLEKAKEDENVTATAAKKQKKTK